MAQTEYAAPVSQGDQDSTVLRKIAYAAQNGSGGGGLTPSGVTPGSYTNTNLTVDVNGIITAASNGFDPASPGPIGGTTPASGAFTTLSATPGNNATGLTVTGGSITGSGTTPSLSITQTWNTTGSPSGIFANFTNTASGGSTNVIDLQVGGVSVFAIGKDGVYRTSFNGAGNMTTFAEISTQAGGVTIKGQVRLSAEGNGLLQLVDASTFNSFNRLAFGGTDANYPSIKRSTTILQARLADDSAFTVLQADLRTTANAVAESIVPTHTVLIQDATGTSYKIAVQAA